MDHRKQFEKTLHQISRDLADHMKHTILLILKRNSKHIYISNNEYEKICFGRATLHMQYAFVRESLDLVSTSVTNSTKRDNNVKLENTSISIMEARSCNNTRAEFNAADFEGCSI